MLLRWRNWIIFVMQSVAIGAALLSAWLLRFDFTVPHRQLLLSSATLLLVIRLGAMYYYKLNHGYWRYTGITDLKDLIKAVSLGSVIFFVFMRISRVLMFPLSIYVLRSARLSVSGRFASQCADVLSVEAVSSVGDADSCAYRGRRFSGCAVDARTPGDELRRRWTGR